MRKEKERERKQCLFRRESFLLIEGEWPAPGHQGSLSVEGETRSTFRAQFPQSSLPAASGMRETRGGYTEEHPEAKHLLVGVLGAK